MSVPKYIKKLSKNQKRLKFLFKIIVIISLIIFIVHFAVNIPSNLLFTFLYPELYIFWAALIGYAYFHLLSWKEKIYYAENDIYETIAYRDKTSIRNIAQVKGLKEKDVITILQRLIAQEKLFGEIRDGLYLSDKTLVPICTLCNKKIDDKLIMVLCPFCKRPFHKDHIIDYINEMDEKCPNCKHPLTIADIIK